MMQQVQIPPVPGWLSAEKICALAEAAARVEAEGQTVEIGCFLGCSTAAIGTGLKMRGKGERVIVIDQFGAPPSDPKLDNEFTVRGDVKAQFLENMAKYDIPYELHHMSAAEARERGVVTGPIRFASIDGDHSYEGVKHDIEWLLPLMAEGGVMVFDDCAQQRLQWRNHSIKWGVLRAVRELVLPRAKAVALIDDGDMRFIEV